jgi:hypothetical protein
MSYNMCPETMRFRDTHHRHVAQDKLSKHGRFVHTRKIVAEENLLKKKSAYHEK